MITLEDILYSENEKGLPLVFVINNECVFDYPFNKYGTDLMLKNKGILDISSEYPEHEGITLKIEKEYDFEIFQTSEYFGSILLSDPTVLCLWDYPYGQYVMSPHAQFDGENFIITDQDMDSLIPYPHEVPYTSSEFFML